MTPEHWNIYDDQVLAWRLKGHRRSDTLRDLTHLREAIEPDAARLAAVRATAEECGALTGAVSGLAIADRSGDAQKWLTHALHFHSTVLRASKNTFYARAVPLIQAALQAEPNTVTTSRTDALPAYADTAGAIQRGDAAAASVNMARVVPLSVTASRPL